MSWYYVDAGQQAGPVTDEELDNLVRSGKVRADTLIWREGMANWVPHGQARPSATPPPAVAAPPVGAAVPPPAAGGEVVCAECSQLFPRQNTIQYGSVFVCTNCQPRFVQRVQQGMVGGSEFQLDYAGFWIRFLAKLIDWVIVALILGVPLGIITVRAVMQAGGAPTNPFLLAGPKSWAIQGISNVVVALITGWFLGKFGATPGKMALGLKVVNPDGSKISYGRAFGRAFGEILTGLTCYLLGIGYIIAGFDREKRALHDHIAGTRVIKTR
jgi:uncharacterized RDD family membrane protein YckC